MRPASINLTPEGWPVIGLTALSALVFSLIKCWPLAVLFLVLCWFSCHFFRDPERVTPQEKGLVVSPADGKIIRIETREDPLTGEQRQCISIFMNVFSVHVNRAPVESTVESIRYFSGTYYNAAWDKASTENERCAYLLREESGDTLTMVQIAGLIARRIVCRVHTGDSLARGERYGMIRFGSRVDLYLPAVYTLSTKIGEQVYAGESILAKRS